MIWVDHNKVVLQNKSTYFDGGNKIHNIESSSNIKENEMYIFQITFLAERNDRFHFLHYPGSEVFYSGRTVRKRREEKTSGDPCMKCSSHVTIQVSISFQISLFLQC